MSLFSRVLSPRYPSVALGLEKGRASIVDLALGRGGTYTLRRAATIGLSDSTIEPSFDQTNLRDPSELANALRDLSRSAGLMNHKRWSITLPEATSRTLIFSLETVTSSSELDDVLRWKLERGFDAPAAELSVSTLRLDSENGKNRYLATAIRATVLAEYEAVFKSLGWRVGLVVPRHVGEAQWLTRNGSSGDSLLISFSSDGFTAEVLRDRQPSILRVVTCDPEECEDELYRLLLFYRERRGGESDVGIPLQRVLVLGEGIPRDRVMALVNETLGLDLRVLDAEDVGLELPTRELTFDQIAAPAGLATLSKA